MYNKLYCRVISSFIVRKKCFLLYLPLTRYPFILLLFCHRQYKKYKLKTIRKVNHKQKKNKII